MNKVINQREENYGEFKVISKISQDFKDIAREAPQFDNLEAYQKESIEMILHKVARILNGNPNYIDSWRDIVGYAELVVDRLLKTKGAVDSKITKIVIDEIKEV